jgi:hypothetical protein
MARTTRNSSGSSGASGSNDVHDDVQYQNAIGGNIEDLAERLAQQEALDAIAAANAHVGGIVDPVAKRLSLIAQVNATKLASEKARKIAKGLLILQSKEPPFEVEDMLKKNDILQLKLTEEETNELLEEYIEHPTIEKNKDNSVKFIGAMVHLSPLLNKDVQILQAKSLPFQVEEILQQPDMISLNLNEDETTELLEKLLTDTWRFCIDYRKPNDYTKSADWPIPSMQQ